METVTVVVDFLPMRGLEIFLVLPVIIAAIIAVSGNASAEHISVVPAPTVRRRQSPYRLRLVYSKGIDPHSYDPLDSAREVQA